VLSAFISSLRTADLRSKILFTLGIVILYRAGATLPSPGINYSNVDKCISELSGGDNGQIYSLINLFSGGALLQLTVFAVGVMPYITASIIVQLLTVVIPRFEQLRKEGQSGQAKMTQYTRYLAIALAILQADDRERPTVPWTKRSLGDLYRRVGRTEQALAAEYQAEQLARQYGKGGRPT